MKTRDLTILIAFILLKFLLQYLLLDSVFDLHRDEYLHLDQANHLAWGYTSVPPLTSWISLIIKLLGNGVFWVKFFPALFGTLTLVVVWQTVEELNGNLFAKIFASTAILFSVLLRINTLYQPNSFDILSWTATFYFIIKYINTQKVKWLFITSILFALGILNKYNILFLFLGLFPALLITKERRLFFKKELIYATSIALIILLPNIIWQIKNNFPVVHHLKELANTQLVNVSRLSFLQNQLLFFGGSVVVILCALYALLLSKTFVKFRFLFWTMLFVLTIFTWLKAKDYYAIGLYPIYIAVGSVYLNQITKGVWGNIIKYVLLVQPLVYFSLIINVAFPNKTPQYMVQHQADYKKYGLLRWEDGVDHSLPQDFADMLGWKELAEKVDKSYEKIDSAGNTLVLCDNYGQAGAINFYSKQGIKAVSFNADYINWFNLDVKYVNFIRVKESSEKYTELEKTSPYFQRSTYADSVTNIYAREFGTAIFVFEGAKVDINKRLKSEIEKVKRMD